MRFCHLCGVEVGALPSRSMASIGTSQSQSQTTCPFPSSQVVLADFDSHLPKCGRLWLMDHDLPVDAVHKLPIDPGFEERPDGGCGDARPCSGSYICGDGASSAVWIVLFAHPYGTAHLGKITGFASSLNLPMSVTIYDPLIHSYMLIDPLSHSYDLV